MSWKYVQTKIGVWKFIATLQPKGRNGPRYTHIEWCYFTIKRTEVLIHATTWMIFEKRKKVKGKSLSHVRLFATPMDCSLPGSSIHGIFQARVLEWIAVSFSRVSSRPRDWTRVSHIAGRCFTIWATREGLDQESNPHLSLWNCGVLTTGLHYCTHLTR